MSKAVELQTGWFTRQKHIHGKYRMTIDQMLVCWNYATMMKQRGLTLTDIATQCGISKEGVRQWFERGLPEHCLTRLDDAIHALVPVDPPDDGTIRVWERIMAEGWLVNLKDHPEPGHVGGQGKRHESEKELARLGRLPEQGKRAAAAIHEVAQARTHCIRGHEFTPENTRLRPPTNRRECRTCSRARNRAQKERYAAQTPTPQQQRRPAGKNRNAPKAPREVGS